MDEHKMKKKQNGFSYCFRFRSGNYFDKQGITEERKVATKYMLTVLNCKLL